jgi:hypothetical protein
MAGPTLDAETLPAPSLEKIDPDVKPPDMVKKQCRAVKENAGFEGERV